MGEFAIGQSVSRFEDPRLLKGGGRYVADMVLPGMVFGHVLRSPHAHARIRSIDVSRAKAAPGVLVVLTGANWKASGWGDLPVPGGLKRRDGSAQPDALNRWPCRRLHTEVSTRRVVTADPGPSFFDQPGARVTAILRQRQEMLEQDQKIVRPRQVYTGAAVRDYVPMSARA